MNPQMILDFSNNLSPLGLTQIGQLAGARMQQRRANKQQAAMEEAYSKAFELVVQDPSEENVARFYKIAQPMGRFDDARNAVNDYFDRQQQAIENGMVATGAAGADIPAQSPNVTAYISAFEAWRHNKFDPELQDNLLIASQLPDVDKFDEANKMVGGAISNRDTAQDEAAYDAALAEYERNPTADARLSVLSTASRLGWADAANQTLDSIEANRSAADKARILSDQRSALFAAQDEFDENRTPENYRKMVQAAEPLGEYQNMVDYANKLNADEITQDVNNVMSVLSPLSVNDIDSASAAVDRLTEAFADNPEQLDRLQIAKDKIDSGDIVGAREYLYTLLSTTQQGRDTAEQLLSFNADKRSEAVTAGQLISIANQLEFATEEQKQDFRRAADGLPYPTAQALANFARVAVPDATAAGEAQDRLLDREEELRKEYEHDTHSYTIIAQNVENLESQYDLDNMSGMTDQAFITIFNKILDPTSSVRESEAARTAAAQAFLGRVSAAAKGIATGESLSPTTRADIVEAARALGQVAENYRSSYRNRIQNVIDVFDPDGSLGSASRIFRDTVPEAEAKTSFNDAVDTLVDSITKEYNVAGEDIRSLIRTQGITTVDGLQRFAGNTDFSSVPQKTITTADGIVVEEY